MWLDRTLIEGPYLALCLTEKDYMKALKHLKVPANKAPPLNEAAAVTMHFENGEGDSVCIVSVDLRKNPNKRRVHSLLNHEAVHVWQYFCKEINETNPSPEFEAYSIQAITDTLIKEYKRQTKR